MVQGARNFVVVSTRDDLLITQELVRLLSTEVSDSRIYVACPSPCLDGARAWIEKIKNDCTAKDITIELLPFDPYGDRKACRSAANKLVDALRNCTIDGLALNWQGCLPGRFGVVLEESGMLEMAQVKILTQLYFIEALIEKKMLCDQSRVVVSGSEAARGIPPTFPVPIFGDSLDSFCAILDGSALDSDKGNPIYGHVQAILSLYVGALARKHPQIYFCSLSPGFTQDSLNKNIQIEATPMEACFSDLVKAGIAQDFTVAARNFYNAVTGDAEWTYPSGALVASVEGTSGLISDQSSTESGKYLKDASKQDLSYEALHKFA